MFTSDPVLNPCPGGWLSSDVLGRISVTAAAVGNSTGRIAEERLAAWLMLRNRKGGTIER